MAQTVAGVTQPARLMRVPLKGLQHANVNNSASDNFGAMPTFGRHGTSSGWSFNVSSIRA